MERCWGKEGGPVWTGEWSMEAGVNREFLLPPNDPTGLFQVGPLSPVPTPGKLTSAPKAQLPPHAKDGAVGFTPGVSPMVLPKAPPAASAGPAGAQQAPDSGTGFLPHLTSARTSSRIWRPKGPAQAPPPTKAHCPNGPRGWQG